MYHQDIKKEAKEAEQECEHFAAELESDALLGPFMASPQITKKAKKTNKELRKLPDKLTINNIGEFWPKALGSYPFVDAGCMRLRGYYLNPKGGRTNHGASLTTHGEEGACKRVLRWAWRQHAAFSGATCNITDLYDTE